MDKNNIDKFLDLVSDKESQAIEKAKYRVENRKWLRISRFIAVEILFALEEQKMTQKDLADKMGVSPQYVNKLVKGSENLTLETIVKIQDILNIQILKSLITSDNKNVLKVHFKPVESLYEHNYQNYSIKKCDNVILAS